MKTIQDCESLVVAASERGNEPGDYGGVFEASILALLEATWNRVDWRDLGCRRVRRETFRPEGLALYRAANEEDIEKNPETAGD